MRAVALGLAAVVQAQIGPLFDNDVGANNENLASFQTGSSRQLPGAASTRSLGLQCGNPRVDHNGDIFHVPDRTLIDFEVPEPFSHGLERFAEGPYGPMGDGFRIVGGAEAVPHSWPWQVRVRTCSKWRCTYLCGGSIINDRWIVTAAHCVPYKADRGVITVGNHRLFDDGSYSDTAKNYTISKIINHEGWNRYIRWNDITLVQVAEKIIFNDHVQPICLPEKDACVNPGSACVVSGWGYMSESGPLSPTLQEVAVRVIDHTTCKSAMWYSSAVYDTQVCAGYVDGGRDSCAGDSGGPLVCRSSSNGPWFLYGVVSWGYGCARKTKPGVYTKIPKFMDWIESKIKAAGDGEKVNKLPKKQFPCTTCGDHEPGQCHSSTIPWQTEEGSDVPTLPPTKATTTVATTTTTTTTTPVSACGGVLSADNGKFTTPGFPNEYSPNQKCEWTIKGNPEDWVRVKLETNQLDRKSKCWQKGDVIYITCGKRREVYCNDWDYTRTGMVQCKGEITVEFSSDAVEQGTGGSFTYDIQRNVDMNPCKQAVKRVLKPGSDMEDNTISIWPMSKSSHCRFTLEVEKGKKAMVTVNRVKTYLSAKERYQRKQRKWVALRCYDKVTFYNENNKKIGHTCGRRSLKNNYQFRSNTNKIHFALQTDGRTSRMERFDAYFTQVN